MAINRKRTQGCRCVKWGKTNAMMQRDRRKGHLTAAWMIIIVLWHEIDTCDHIAQGVRKLLMVKVDVNLDSDRHKSHDLEEHGL